MKPRRNFNLYTLMRAILLQISRRSGMRGLKTGYGLEWARYGPAYQIVTRVRFGIPDRTPASVSIRLSRVCIAYRSTTGAGRRAAPPV